MLAAVDVVDFMLHQTDDCSLSLTSRRDSNCIVKEVHMITRATVKAAERRKRVTSSTCNKGVQSRINSYLGRMNRDHALCMQHCCLTQCNRADEIKHVVHRILLGNNTIPGVMRWAHQHKVAAVHLLFRKVIVFLDELTQIAEDAKPERKIEEDKENTRKRKCCSNTPIWLKQWAARPDAIYKHKLTLAICSEDDSIVPRQWSPEVGRPIGDGYVVVKKARTHMGIGMVKEKEDTLQVLQQVFRMACNLAVCNKLSLMMFGLLMLSVRKWMKPPIVTKAQSPSIPASRSFYRGSTALYNLLTVALTVGQFWRADKFL
jgi:hypothetical protein